MKKYVAEFIGTFWLVFGGGGIALLAAGFPNVGISTTPGIYCNSGCGCSTGRVSI